MLSDMENSLSLIKNNKVKSIMKDALLCYNTNILKGCVIFIYHAVFLHIEEDCKNIKKFLSDELKAWVKNTFENKDSYTPEQSIANKLYKENIIDEQVFNFLTDLIQKRNRCAHADFSFVLTNEDARYLFHNAIILLLQYINLSGESEVGHILELITYDRVFEKNTLKEQSDLIKNKILFNTKNMGFLAGRILLAYDEAKENYVKNNIEILLFHLCKEYPNLSKIIFNRIKDEVLNSSNERYRNIFKILLLSTDDIFSSCLSEKNDGERRKFLRVLDEIDICITSVEDIDNEKSIMPLSQKLRRHLRNINNKDEENKIIRTYFPKDQQNYDQIFQNLATHLTNPDWNDRSVVRNILDKELAYLSYHLNDNDAIKLYIEIIVYIKILNHTNVKMYEEWRYLLDDIDYFLLSGRENLKRPIEEIAESIKFFNYANASKQEIEEIKKLISTDELRGYAVKQRNNPSKS